MHSTQHVANSCKCKWGLTALEQSGFFLFLLLDVLSWFIVTHFGLLGVKHGGEKSCMFLNEFGQGLSGIGWKSMGMSFLFPGRGDWSRNWQKD